MKKKIFITFVTLLFSSFIFAQTPLWTVGTARTVHKNDLDLSTFYFTKYGLTNFFELQAKPLYWWKLPQLNGKLTWYYHKGQKHKNYLRSRDYLIGSIHGVNYPTWALRTFASKGYYNSIIPESSVIPSIFAFRNEILLTTILTRRKTCSTSNSLITFKAGVKSAYKTDTVILAPFEQAVYARESQIYRDKLLWYLGVDWDAKLSYGLNYTLDADIYSIGLNTDYWAFEHKGLVYWHMGYNKRIRIVLGYKFGYTNLPDTRMQVSPFVDFTLLLRPRRNKHTQLFPKGMDNSSDIRDMFYRENKKKKKKKKKEDEK